MHVHLNAKCFIPAIIKQYLPTTYLSTTTYGPICPTTREISYWNTDWFEGVRVKMQVQRFFFIFYLVQQPTNPQLSDKLLYCFYMFRHYCVILRELVVRILLSYIRMSVKSLIQFKISNFFVFKNIKIVLFTKTPKIILFL